MKLEEIKNLDFSNVKGVVKYSFLGLKERYIVQVVFLGLVAILNVFIGKYTMGLEFIPVLAIGFTINLIGTLSIFNKQLSKEYGRLMFLAPINGLEFVLGNILQMFLANLSIGVMCILWASIFAGFVPQMLTSMVISMVFGFLSIYLVLSSGFVIASRYINNSGLKVFLVLIFSMLGTAVFYRILFIILKAFPYIYISLSGWINCNIDIFKLLFTLLALISLQFVAINFIDNKLDIS